MSQIAEFYSRFLVLQYKIISADDLSQSVIDLVLTQDDKWFIRSLTMSDKDMEDQITWSQLAE